MNKHNDIYNILGKLASLEPAVLPKKENILKTLTESSAPSVKSKLMQKWQELNESAPRDDTNYDIPTYQRKNPKASEPTPDWVGKNTDVPAYKRKATSGNKDAAAELNKASGAQVWRNSRPKMAEGEVVKTKTGIIHKGTYGSDAYDTGSEDDYDEYGNKKEKAAKAGRPAKAKAPERVTSKAWKHKDGRLKEASKPDANKDGIPDYAQDGKGAKDLGKGKGGAPKKGVNPFAKVKEAINLDTFVEDSMKEIQGVFVAEKAVSKQQQKFMGMVHSMQSGNKVKGASPELKKVAKDMDKKDAKDFAGTKHKGLPKKVSESVQLTESTIDAICHRYGRECKDFMTTGDMADDLYHALYDYYFDDMPYGVKKARDGDPYEWVADRFHDDMGGNSWQADNAPSAIPSNVKVEADNSLAELARLAGYDMPLQEEPNEGNEFSGARANAIRAGKDSFSVDGKVYKVSGEEISESTCNMTAEGKMCPKHGFAECAMYESIQQGMAEGSGDPEITPGMKTQYGTVVSVNGNTVTVKASNGELTTVSIHDIDQGMSEGSEQNLTVQQLATISDEALDKAYGYGRSTPGNSFGWQANLMSATYAKKMIDAGVTDIEKISDAIHNGWNVTAQKFVQNPDQFGDTEKLRQAGKLEGKLQQRTQLMKQNYSQLPNDEQEKDRVVARALLQAIKGPQGVAENNKEKVDECGMPGGMDTMSQDSGFNVSTNVDTKTGRKSVTVTADGDAADQLAQMLKMAGMQASGHSYVHAVEEMPVEEEYSNEPDEKYATIDTIISQGDDLHRQKKQYADKPKAGDNPMATETALRLEGKLAAMYASLKMKSQ